MGSSTMEFMQVILRPRPSARGDKKSTIQFDPENPSVLRFCLDGAEPKPFSFNKIFGEDATQSDVFSSIVRIVEGVPLGINGTVFAYGQTGSGKTHTMLGNSRVDGFIHDDLARGIIPRSADFLFRLLEKEKQKLGDNFMFTVNCAFVELYNEVFYDLVSETQTNTIVIRSAKDKSVKLEGSTRVEVGSAHDVMKVLQQGWNGRKVGETAMNRESSRSHALLIIDVSMQKNDNGVFKTMNARLNLVDLAGSERQSQTKAEGARLQEACKINQSLSVLGRVIRFLAEPNGGYVPYRDSKLTHVLSDSLGGNCRTAVVVNIHPDKEFALETLSTLQFASSCALVKNHAKSNLRVDGESIMALRAAVEKLTRERDEIAAAKDREHHADMEKQEKLIAEWRQKARDNERELCIYVGQLEALRVMSRRNLSEDELSRITQQTTDSVMELWKPDAIQTVAELDVFELNRQLRLEKEKSARLENELRAIRRFSNTEMSILGDPNQSLSNSILAKTPDMNTRRKNRRRTGVFTPADQEFARNASMRAPPTMLFDDVTSGEENKENVMEQLGDAAAKMSIKENADIEQLKAELEQKEELEYQLNEENLQLKQSLKDLEESHNTQRVAFAEELSKSRNSNDDLQREMDAKMAEIKTLESTIASQNKHVESLTNDLNIEIRKGHALEADINRLRSELADAENSVRVMENRKEIELLEEKERVAKMVEELLVKERDAKAMEGESNEKMASLRGEIAELQLEKTAALEKKEETIRAITERMGALEQEVQHCSDKLREVRRKLDEKTYEVDGLKAEIENQKELHQMDMATKEEMYTVEKARLVDDRDDLRRRLATEEQALAAAREANQKFIEESNASIQQYCREIAQLEGDNAVLMENLQAKEETAESQARDLVEKQNELRKKERHFKDKMAELKSTFDKKESSASREAAAAKAALDDANDAYERVQAQFAEASSAKEVVARERDAMRQQIQTLERESEERKKVFDEMMARHAVEAEQLAGNSNHSAKIKYLSGLKEQLGAKTKEVEKLTALLAKKDSLLLQHGITGRGAPNSSSSSDARSSATTTTTVRVTRSSARH